MTRAFRPFAAAGFLLLALCTATAVLADATQSPDEAYLAAYMLKKEAQKKETASDLQSAHETFRRASHAYDFIARQWPNWEPELINYRREQIRKDLARLSVSMQKAGLFETDPRGDLAGAKPLPPVTGGERAKPTPPPTGPGGAGFAEAAQRWQQEYEARIDRAQKEALAARRATERLQGEYQEAVTAVAFAKDEAKRIAAEKAAAEEALSRKAEELKGEKEKGAKELAAARKEIDDLSTQQEKTLAELEKAGARTAELHEQMGEHEKAISDLKAERAELLKQRDEMEALLGSKGGASETETKLMEENRRLRARLAEALKDVADLKKEARSKDAEIASLKDTVRDLRSQVAALTEENQAYQERIGDLTRRLEEASGELTTTNGTAVDPALYEENRILRGVIHRQIKKLSAQKKRGRLLVHQLQQAGLKEKDLIREVEELVGHRLILTEEERTLLKVDFGEGADATLVAESERSAYAKEIAGYEPPVLLKKASENYAVGDFDRTEMLFHRYLRTGDEAKFGPVQANLGVVQMRLAEPKMEDSEENLKQALRKMPDDPFPHFNLGFNYLWRDRADDALLNLESSARLDPENPKARFYLGVACARSEEYGRAREEFQKAVALRPDYGDAHYNLSILHLLDGANGLEKAREHYRRALECGLQPDVKLEEKLNMRSAGR